MATIEQNLQYLSIYLNRAYNSLSSKGAWMPPEKKVRYLNNSIDSLPSPEGDIEIKLNNFGTTQTKNYLSSVSSIITEVTVPYMTDISIQSQGHSLVYGSNSIQKVKYSNLSSINCDYGFFNAFRMCRSLTSIEFPSLIEINGTQDFQTAIASCLNLTNVDFSRLTRIKGTEVFQYFALSSTSLEGISFNSLEEISGNNTFRIAFKNCTNFQYLDCPNLQRCETGTFSRAFENTIISEIYFPSLTSLGANFMNGLQFSGNEPPLLVSLGAVTEIPPSCFNNNTPFTALDLKACGDQPPTIGTDAFAGSGMAYVIVDGGSYDYSAKEAFEATDWANYQICTGGWDMYDEFDFWYGVAWQLWPDKYTEYYWTFSEDEQTYKWMTQEEIDSMNGGGEDDPGEDPGGGEW